MSQFTLLGKSMVKLILLKTFFKFTLIFTFKKLPLIMISYTHNFYNPFGASQIATGAWKIQGTDCYFLFIQP